MILITPTQNKVLEYIKASAPVCPSYRDIAKGCEIKSVATVSSAIDGLVERGYIKKVSGRRRMLQIVK